MKTYLRWMALVFIAGLLMFFSGRLTPSVAKAQSTEKVEVTLCAETFSKDTTIEADRVILCKGGSVRISNGSHLTILAKKLEVQGPFLFDGRGKAGEPGANAGTWTSSGPCSVGIFGPGEVAHRDWEAAGGSSDDRGGNGGNGAPGAVFDVVYGSLVLTGVSGGLRDDVVFMTSGGAAGAAGQGRRLVCGCHSEHAKYGPGGNAGAPGASGSYTVRQSAL